MSQAGAGMKRNAEGWRQNNYTSIILASLMFRENFASLARILKSYHDHENFMFLMINDKSDDVLHTIKTLVFNVPSFQERVLT